MHSGSSGTCMWTEYRGMAIVKQGSTICKLCLASFTPYICMLSSNGSQWESLCSVWISPCVDMEILRLHSATSHLKSESDLKLHDFSFFLPPYTSLTLPKCLRSSQLSSGQRLQMIHLHASHWSVIMHNFSSTPAANFGQICGSYYKKY